MTRRHDASNAPSMHASAVCVGDRAVLIRGPSGAGKSQLAFDLILAGRSGQIAATTLIGDDRLDLEARQGRLMVRPVPQLAGLIEIRGLGIRRCDFVSEAVAGLVVDLAAPDGARLPEPESRRTTLFGVSLPRIPVEAGFSAFPLIVAELTTDCGLLPPAATRDCLKEIGNHITPTVTR